ncbi:hypothetical protein Tco_0411284 [Tanacetum coccineum]
MANDSKIKEEPKEVIKLEPKPVTESVEGPHKIASLPTRIRRSLHMFAFISQGLLSMFYGPITGMVTWKPTQSSPFESHGVFFIICNIAFGIMFICFPVLAFVIVDSEASGSTKYLDATWFHLLSAIALYAVIAAPTSLECVANVPADRLWIGYVILAVIFFAVIFLGFFEYLIILYHYVNAKRAARARKREETIKNKSDGEKANKTDSEEAAEAKKNDPEETAKANKTNHEEAAEAKKNDPEETAKANKSDHEEAATVSNTDSEKEAESEKSK